MKRFLLGVVMVVGLAAGYVQYAAAAPCPTTGTYDQLIGVSCTIDDKTFDSFLFSSSDILVNTITFNVINNSPSAIGFTFQFALNATGAPGCNVTPLPAGCITDFAISYHVTCTDPTAFCITSNHLEIAGFSASNGGSATVGEIYTRDGTGPFQLNVSTNGPLADFDDFAGTHQVILSKDINATCQSQGTNCAVSLSLINNFVDQQAPEPATLALFGAGLAGLAFFRRRRTS